VKSLPLGTEGVLDSALPRAAGRTLYVRAGDGAAGLLIGATFIIVIRRRMRQA
jgi:apolipoprotein N-acyltransferase